MIDLFYECEENDIANYADGVISHCHFWVTVKSFVIILWKPIQVNASTKSPEVVSIDGIQITSSNAKTLLGITINNVNRKINALGRLPIICP